MLKKTFKFLLISTFFSYYFVAIALNYPWINEKFHILDHLNAVKLKQISKKIYLGTYPDYQRAKFYKKELKIEALITLLDPNFPGSREMVKNEKKICKSLGLELIIIPISLSSKNPMDYILDYYKKGSKLGSQKCQERLESIKSKK